MKKDNYNEIEEYCAYCEYAKELHDTDTVLCEKKGVVLSTFRCRKFSYDPLKRKPNESIAPKLDFINID